MILVRMQLVAHMGELVPVEYALSAEHGMQWLQRTYPEAGISYIGRPSDPAGLSCGGKLFIFPFNNLEFFERAVGCHAEAGSWSYDEDGIEPGISSSQSDDLLMCPPWLVAIEGGG